MNEYTTSRGVKVRFRPISKATLLRFHAANPQPEVPTYKTKSKITGAEEEIPLDERSLTEKPEQFTTEEHAAWKTYSDQQSEFVMRFIQFFCLRGLSVNASMDDWLEERQYLNIPVPENRTECRFEWMADEILETPEDYEAVILGVIEAAGVPADLLEQVRASFRGDVSGSTAEAPQDREGTLESGSELRRSAGNVALAVDAIPVAKVKRARPRVGARDARNA